MSLRRLIPSLLLLLLIFPYSCKKDAENTTSTVPIKVGALLSLTGNWSDLGTTSKSALEIAVEEINADFVVKGLPYRFSLSTYDTQLDPVIAASNLTTAASSGCRLFIGPQSSAEVAAVKAIADSLGLLVVSQGSTASTLAISNDAIFRYCPGDQIEGTAIANTAYIAGKRAIVTLARNDAGNLGLQNSVTAHFQTLGGAVVSAGNYAVNETDFTSALNVVRNEISTLKSTYTAAQIGVYLASFDEAVQLFNQAAGDTVLSGVNWYGGDGFIKNTNLLNDTAAASFVLATQFFSPEFGLPNYAQSIWQPLITKVLNRCGQTPDAFALAAYDAIKVMAKTIEANNGLPATGTTLQSSFYTLSNQYSGATGTVMLNSAGDRATGSFNYWGLIYNNGVYSWTMVGQSN
ncbi:MAG: hypothetical protein RIQ47_1856 [Bacteroidota bacterium]|jgi:branched-chain amino acid transport system substrate-binding protein